jgi:hypothetical protein
MLLHRRPKSRSPSGRKPADWGRKYMCAAADHCEEGRSLEEEIKEIDVPYFQQHKVRLALLYG